MSVNQQTAQPHYTCRFPSRNVVTSPASQSIPGNAHTTPRLLVILTRPGSVLGGRHSSQRQSFPCFWFLNQGSALVLHEVASRSRLWLTEQLPTYGGHHRDRARAATWIRAVHLPQTDQRAGRAVRTEEAWVQLDDVVEQGTNPDDGRSGFES